MQLLEAAALTVCGPTTLHRIEGGALSMTRISRVLIESNRITILRRHRPSYVRCQHCGEQMDLMNVNGPAAVVIDQLQEVVELEMLPVPQSSQYWLHALF